MPIFHYKVLNALIQCGFSQFINRKAPSLQALYGANAKFLKINSKNGTFSLIVLTAFFGLFSLDYREVQLDSLQ